MPNVHNRIPERLRNDKDTELMRHELESMLECELAKPESEVDAQLVEELLDALEAEEPGQSDKQIAWNAIEEALRRDRSKRKSAVLRRIAACAAAFIVLSLAAFGTAKAFNWAFLLKLLAPVADTFGIQSAANTDFITSDDSVSVYTVEDTEFAQIQYTSPEEFPAQWNGVPVQPAWMPERFAFADGSVYDDGDVAVLSASYMGGEDFFNLTTTIFADENNVSSYEYERTLEVPIIEEIAGHEVTFYHNMDEDRLSASWIEGNIHYLVSGNVTGDELKKIIAGVVEA